MGRSFVSQEDHTQTNAHSIVTTQVREEAQKRWKRRRDKSWTSNQEREYRKMIRKTQDADVYITFNNKIDGGDNADVK